MPKKKNKKKHLKATKKINDPVFMTKVFYASQNDYFLRVPELKSLQTKSIAVFGLGSLGAPSVLEFVHAGIGRIKLIDYDTIDPCTTVRWPFGFDVAAYKKTEVLKEFILRSYPYTEPIGYDLKIGGMPSIKKPQPSQSELISEIVDGIDLIYDCTAEWGVNHFLSDLCSKIKIPYIGVSGTHGGWGGKIFRIRPYKGTGCWCCYGANCKEGTIPEPPVNENKSGKTQPTGCADPTFTGAGFDMVQIAIMGVKMAISTLCEGEVDAYPSFDGDAVHIHMRNEDGSLIAPVFKTYKIERRVGCEVCNGKA